MPACCRHYPGRIDGTDSLVPFHQLRPSPDYRWVGSCIISFEACSAFTRVTTYRLTKSPYATLSTGGFSGFVASTADPIAAGRSDPVPGRVFSPAVDQRLSRRTANACLHQLWKALVRQRSLLVVKSLAIRAISLFLVVVAPTALGQKQVSAPEKNEAVPVFALLGSDRDNSVSIDPMLLI